MNSGPNFDISAIIVSYNVVDLLGKCLDSILSQSDIKQEAIVVDNASSDHTPEIIARDFSGVKLIANKENLGFARANNVGLRVSTGKYIHFLNPDTEVHPGAFSTILEFMEGHPKVGIAGTRIVNPDGSPQPSVEKRYPGQRHAREELKGLQGDIAWVVGASIIARRSVAEELGGFDDLFFLYAEEIDLCLRARKKGWLIDYIPDAIVMHWGGQSEKGNPSAAVWKRRLNAEILFYRKHYKERTFRAIARSNILQAYWRILSLKMTLPFMINRDSALGKLEKYRLALDIFRHAKYAPIG